MLAALLPVVWLIASGHVLLEQSYGGIGAQEGASVSAVQGDSHGILDDARTVDSKVRRLNRRTGAPFDTDGFVSSPVSSISQQPKLECSPKLRSGAPPDLAQQWQFYLRAALEPRAPSTAS